MSPRVEVIETAADFAAIGADWQQLHDAAGGGPFSSAAWIEAWWDVYGTDHANPVILCAWQDGTLLAGLPLGVRRSRMSSKGPKVRKLGMLCDERAGFHDILVRPGAEAVLEPMVAALVMRGGWQMMDLTPVQPGSALEAFCAACRKQGLSVRQRQEYETAICDLRDGWEAYMQRRSRNFRKSARVSDRALQARAHAFIESRETGPEADRILQRIFDLSSRCWKAKMGTDIGADAQFCDFLKALFPKMAAQGGMSLYLLEVEGQDAASYLAFDVGTSSFAYLSEFDEMLKEVSPGRAIELYAYERACARGLERVNMLRRSPFTERFADIFEGYDRVRVCRRIGLINLGLGLEERLRRLGKAARKQRVLKTRKRVAYKDQ